MKFFKEYVMIVLIIVFVILAEFITSKITCKVVEDINYYINFLEEGIDNNDIGDKMEKLSSQWRKSEIKLAFFMEHSELEKINADITNLRSNVYNRNNNNYEDIKELIDEIKYRLEYVKNKQKLGLKNIF